VNIQELRLKSKSASSAGLVLAVSAVAVAVVTVTKWSLLEELANFKLSLPGTEAPWMGFSMQSLVEATTRSCTLVSQATNHPPFAPYLCPLPELTYRDNIALAVAIADFLNGPRQGARDLLSHVQSTLSSCPDTKFVLVGYSQGAMVVVNAENDNSLPVDSVVATIFYGKWVISEDAAYC
jgi:hypothetical protein